MSRRAMPSYTYHCVVFADILLKDPLPQAHTGFRLYLCGATRGYTVPASVSSRRYVAEPRPVSLYSVG